MEHPEITWIQRTGYPSWMQPKRKPRRLHILRCRIPKPKKGGMHMTTGLTPLHRVEELMECRLEQMASEEGMKFDSQDFKRNVSALKELKDMIRDSESRQPRETITVRLEGETEGFAQ